MADLIIKGGEVINHDSNYPASVVIEVRVVNDNGASADGL